MSESSITAADAGRPFAPTGRDGGGDSSDRNPIIRRTETLGIPVHALASDRDVAADAALDAITAARQPTVLVTFANPGTAVSARHSASLRQNLGQFDLVLPDGIGMSLAVRWRHGCQASRVSFDTTSLAPRLFEHARRNRLSIALVGGRRGVAEVARKRIASQFPGIQIIGAFEGYGDAAATIRALCELDPRIVICGMGGGHQERFLLQLAHSGWSGLGFTCGGYLDQLRSGMTYYPRWIDAANLRWAYRLAREPRRLWRRYVIDYSRFALLLFADLASRSWTERKRA